MRILYVADDLYDGFGGQARATQGHLTALADRGHQVTAIAGSERNPTQPPPSVRLLRTPSLRLGGAQTRLAYPMLTLLEPEIASADVLHANTPGPLTAAALLIARRHAVPTVLGVHTQLETSTLQLPQLADLLEAGLSRWYRWLFSRADLLVAPTEFAAATSRRFSAVRVEVVSNGIDFASYAAVGGRANGAAQPEPDRHHADPAQDGPNRVRMLYLGRLSPEKRPLDMLAMLRELPGNYELDVAGNGPLMQEMAALVDRLGLAGRVRLHGYVDEARKRELLASSLLFIMPSPAELQSIATLEAMAAGCAVVAFDHPTSAVPRFVAGSGGGIVVPVDDPRAQAAAVELLASDVLRLGRCGELARDYARSHDVARSAERLEQLYLELVAAGRRGA